LESQHGILREKLLLPRSDPAVPSGGLTLRAVAIAIAVIVDKAIQEAEFILERIDKRWPV
jgi:hypothetical protein